MKAFHSQLRGCTHQAKLVANITGREGRIVRRFDRLSVPLGERTYHTFTNLMSIAARPIIAVYDDIWL